MGTSVVVNASGIVRDLMFKVKFVRGMEHAGQSLDLRQRFCEWDPNKKIEVVDGSILGILAANGMLADNPSRHLLFVLGSHVGGEVFEDSLKGSQLAKLRTYGSEQYVHPQSNIIFSLK